jgi:hypothetical protein
MTSMQQYRNIIERGVNTRANIIGYPVDVTLRRAKNHCKVTNIFNTSGSGRDLNAGTFCSIDPPAMPET